jgi:hypothetical protein
VRYNGEKNPTFEPGLLSSEPFRTRRRVVAITIAIEICKEARIHPNPLGV